MLLPGFLNLWHGEADFRCRMTPASIGLEAGPCLLL
jgi:hypothetical protein